MWRYLLPFNMEVAGFFKTLITIHQITRHHIPEDTTLHSHHTDIISFVVACRIFPLLLHHCLFIRAWEHLQCNGFVWDVTLHCWVSGALKKGSLCGKGDMIHLCNVYSRDSISTWIAKQGRSLWGLGLLVWSCN